MKPASHALTVSYANAGSFSNLNIEANNNLDKDSENGLMNMFNGDIEWSMSGKVSFRRETLKLFGLQVVYKRTCIRADRIIHNL